MRELRDRVRELYTSRRIVGLANEDAAELVDLLADPEVRFRFFVGDLIVRNARGALDALVNSCTAPEAEARRSAVFLLGKIAGKGDKARSAEVGDALSRALKDDDPKVRRNASIALGELEDGGRVSGLQEALNVEPFDWVRPSMILAIGKIGGTHALDALNAYSAGSKAESEALTKALDRATITASPSREALALLGDREIQVHCAPGLEDVTADLFERGCGTRPQRVQNGALRLRLDELGVLAGVRSWHEWLVVVGERTLADSSESCAEREGLELVRSALVTCTEIHAAVTAPTRYRIELRGKGMSHVSRRKLVKAWVGAIDRDRSDFTNSPSHYEFEIRLVRAKTKVAAFLKLTDETDSRFSYREADVPAAMHPATAAGILQLSGVQREGGRALDPFCGSGTLLFERAKSGVPYDAIVGSDISGNAVDAARRNLSGGDLDDALFRRGDVQSVEHSGTFSELISNLPYGIRTGSHKSNVETYRALFDRIPEWLEVGAGIALVTQEIDLMTSLFRERECVELKSVHRVDTGGLQPGVFVGSRIEDRK